MPLGDRLHRLAVRGCLIAVIAIGGAALSPVSQPSPPAERLEEQRHNTSEPDERAPQQPKDVGIAGVGAPATKPASEGESRKSENEWAQYAAYFKKEDSIAQWLMMLASLAATGISLWAVCLLRDTLKATRHTIRVAARANEVATAANKAAYASVAVTQDTAIRQLRAYIVVETASDGVVEVGQHVRVPMKLRNLGQTPAKNAAIASNLIVRGLPYPLARQHQEAGPETVSDGRPRLSIYPGLDQVSPRESDFILEKKTFDAIRNGMAAVFLSGIVIYDDIYDQERETRFRFEFSGEECFQTGRMRVSREGNGVT
ncbi:MAG: hypothetical protein RIC85_05370 [Gammaproteobacteria bacterium]|uniref:hypothetical protein n=1 Tax=Thalassobaculum sp. TaxID=2022740 RepID=UPI0032EF2D18